MGKVGNVLELMHGARHRWVSIRATIRERRHEERAATAADRALERMLEGGRSTVSYRASRHETGVAESEMLTRIWLGSSGRVREEREIVAGAGEPTIGVRDGDWWWLYSPSEGAVSNGGDSRQVAGIGDRTAVLFDPAPVTPGLDLEVLGRCRVGGRRGIRLRATPREAVTPGLLPELDLGAEAYELVVDAERGILLRTEAFAGGEPFSVVEVVDIAFDEKPPRRTFTFAPPDGEIVRPVQSPLQRALSLEEAACAAPFQVWIPSRVPRGFAMDVSFVPAAERPPTVATVLVDYVPDDAAHRLSVRQTAAGELGWADWTEPRTVERDGEEFAVVVPDDEHPWRPTHVFAERGGTSIEITSDLELDTILEIASSLAPAPVEPPRL